MTPRPRSLGRHLAALALGLVVPTLAFVGVLLWQYSVSERTRVEDQAQALARRFALALDREVVNVQGTLQALATSPSLEGGDLAAFHRQASEVARRLDLHFSLRNAEGVTLLTTRAPFGTRIDSRANLLEADLEALRTGRTAVSDVFTGAVSGRPSFQVVVPVPVAGRTAYLLGASFDTEPIAKALARGGVPPGWVAAAVDRKGVVVARTAQHEEYTGKPASETVRARVVGDDGLYYGRNTVGAEVLGAYARSQATGWSVVVNLPAQLAGAALRQALLLLLGLGAGLAALAAALAYGVGRRVAGAVGALREAAGAIGRDEPVRPITTPLSEVDEVGRALAAASTGLRERETALRESEARFRNLADHAPVMVWTTDPDGSCTYLSRSWYEFTGQSEAEGLGFGWLDALHPEDKGWSGEVFLAANAKREPFRLEYRLRRADGSFAWAIDAASPRFGENGEFLGYVGSVVDIDERKRAEVALAESRSRLQAIFDTVPVGLVLAEAPSGRITGGNAQAERIFGHPVLPSPDIEHYREWVSHRPDGRRVEAAEYPLSRVLRDGADRHEMEVIYRRGDGRDAWVRLIAAPIRDEEGRVTGGVVASLDIDREKRAEESLRDLNATLERRVAERTAERDRTWRLSQDLLVVVEADGTLAAVNGRWTALLGWEERELVGAHFADFTHPEDLDATLRAFAGVFEAPLTEPYEYRLRHKDGSYRWFAWTGAFEGGRVFANGRHTTAEREQREALAQAEARLRQSQKMEAVGQLTGGVAHDFNNLLTVVTGNLDMVRRRLDGAGDPRTVRSVENAIEGAKRAAALTARLLAFSRQSPLQPEVVDPNKLVAGMSDLLRRTLGEQISIETVLAGGLWHIEADPNQLENALLNLAVNARDAMPDGGKLTVETANAHLDEAYAASTPEAVKPGQYVLLSVSDTGTGMTPEVKAKVFEPFFTTKEVGKGTGLGLAQVYGFMRQSGGHAAIYSEPGHGTTVKLYFPRLRRAADRVQGEAAADGAALAPAPPATNGETILVVEDEAMVREFSVSALEEAGYRVLSAEDGPSGLALLDAHPEIDLLFTDVVLAGPLSGRKVADEAVKRRPNLKVLFTTGYTRNAIIHHGRLDEGVQLIGKPFTVEQLTAKIGEMLAEESVGPPLVPMSPGATMKD